MILVLWSWYYDPGTMILVLWSWYYDPGTMILVLWSWYYSWEGISVSRWKSSLTSRGQATAASAGESHLHTMPSGLPPRLPLDYSILRTQPIAYMISLVICTLQYPSSMHNWGWSWIRKKAVHIDIFIMQNWSIIIWSKITNFLWYL